MFSMLRVNNHDIYVKRGFNANAQSFEKDFYVSFNLCEFAIHRTP